MTTKNTGATTDRIRTMIDGALAAVGSRPGWDPAAPDPAMIVTRDDAVAALAGIVGAAGCDPVSILSGVLSTRQWKVVPNPSSDIETWLRRLNPITPPAHYERGEHGSWRSLVCQALAEKRRSMTSGEIVAKVASLRGVETGTDRDYRFIERCVGVVLSRYLGQLLNPANRLVQVGSDGRGRRYILAPVETAERRKAA
jgi:hypothetical protein